MTQLENLLQNAGILFVKLENCLSGLQIEGTQNIAAATLHRLSMSHYKSFLILFGMGRRASALALIRPCTDAIQRSIYVFLNESTDLLEKIASDDKHAFGYQHAMVDFIHSELGRPVFADIHKCWSILCSYTHGGVRQMDRQVQGDDLPMLETITDEECIAALVSATFPVVFGTYFLSVAWRRETVTGSYLFMDYMDLLPVPPSERDFVAANACKHRN